MKSLFEPLTRLTEGLMIIVFLLYWLFHDLEQPWNTILLAIVGLNVIFTVVAYFTKD